MKKKISSLELKYYQHRFHNDVLNFQLNIMPIFAESLISIKSAMSYDQLP